MLLQTVIYLAAMVVTVPIARRFGLGAVLGYLIAGALLGPSALRLLGDGESGAGAVHVAEFGVIFMLFLIGLELRPSVLWKLRGSIFGLGGLQMLATTAAFAALAIAFGLPPRTGVAIGMILAMSSTAIVIQTLQERGLAKRSGGEAAFSVLLFQDISVIPVLAILPFLALAPVESVSHGVSAWMQLGRIVGAVVLVIGVGRYLLRYVFRAVAMAKLRELFTAMALLLVLATTLLMQQVGLSPALGAFLAGVVLAESEYRHQLEVDIEPFKGLLLGVFFISIGSGIDFAQVAREPLVTLGLVAGLILVKGAILLGLGRLFRLAKRESVLLAFALAQGGEFAFVLLGISREGGVLGPEAAQLLTAAVAMSMALAPLLISLFVHQVEPLICEEAARRKREPDVVDTRDGQVILAGIGRFGQTISRLLRASGYKVTVLDFDADQVDLMRKFGAKAFFGDASNLDLLHSAGAGSARILAIAIDDYEATLRMAEEVHQRFPHLRILARAYDRVHAYKLIHRGVTDVYIETSGSALNMGTDALVALGVSPAQARRTAALFKQGNEESIQAMAKTYHEADEATFVNQSRGWLDQMEKMLQDDIVQNGVPVAAVPDEGRTGSA
jgi:monovalent cation:proton antiporter-2 (CPA2) family protein